MDVLDTPFPEPPMALSKVESFIERHWPPVVIGLLSIGGAWQSVRSEVQDRVTRVEYQKQNSRTDSVLVELTRAIRDEHRANRAILEYICSNNQRQVGCAGVLSRDP